MTSSERQVSKSIFKAHALEYLREVERGVTLVITDRGKPVVRLSPYSNLEDEEILRRLRGSVLHYEGPTEPVTEADWEALQ